MDELQQVSDGWLAHHNTREKRFSLGAFEPDYILSQPVAVLRKDGKITAFANLMVTETKKEATIDLMRFSADARAARWISSSSASCSICARRDMKASISAWRPCPACRSAMPRRSGTVSAARCSSTANVSTTSRDFAPSRQSSTRNGNPVTLLCRTA
uniref:Phosphatidylglycerol lysyltransferase C-terminal domain-containing protein n=1 Tax=Agrobacterium tumefaciens TaxID=358 RepID=P70781_AGRTU|nr:hypothetical protein [Agrobacterium tumefaciens]